MKLRDDSSEEEEEEEEEEGSDYTEESYYEEEEVDAEDEDEDEPAAAKPYKPTSFWEKAGIKPDQKEEDDDSDDSDDSDDDDEEERRAKYAEASRIKKELAASEAVAAKPKVKETSVTPSVESITSDLKESTSLQVPSDPPISSTVDEEVTQSGPPIPTASLDPEQYTGSSSDEPILAPIPTTVEKVAKEKKPASTTPKEKKPSKSRTSEPRAPLTTEEHDAPLPTSLIRWHGRSPTGLRRRF